MQSKLNSLSYPYPPELVALEPQEPCRVLFMEGGVDQAPKELALSKVLSDVFAPGDVLVVNNSGVKECRVFSGEQEFLFLKEFRGLEWEVLFRAGKFKVGQKFELPGGVQAELMQKGRPQRLKLNQKIDEGYFVEYGQMALPPYIQKLRSDRQNKKEDQGWYQLDWKADKKSLAAPTASLHFKAKDLVQLKEQGVEVVEVNLNVGLGTFLPLEEKNFQEEKLHREAFYVSAEAKRTLYKARSEERRIWALGTTALRAVESMSLHAESEHSETELFIQPGYTFKWVSGLLTNFHQPESSLLCLVQAFYGVEPAMEAYRFAVENKFRLFSYGDLSVWKRPTPQL